MTDPIRLRDQPGPLYADDLARVAKASFVYDAEKGRALLSNTLAANPPSPARWSLWKLGGGAIGVVAVGAMVTAMVGGHGRAPLATVGEARTASSALSEPATTVEREPIAPASDPSATSVAGATPGGPVAGSEPPASAAVHSARTSASAARATVATTASLGEETIALATIRSLSASDPARALVLVEESNRRFADGVFREEREAIAVSALARLGKASAAKARAQRFLATYPKSAFADQVRKNSDLARRFSDPGQ